MTFPGYTMPEELKLLREQVRRFVREEIIPVEQRIDPDAPDIPEEDFKRLSQKTKAAGLWALGAPEEYGGGGMDTFSMAVLVEEMGRAIVPGAFFASVCLAAPLLVDAGTDKQKAELLPGIAAGEEGQADGKDSHEDGHLQLGVRSDHSRAGCEPWMVKYFR